MAAKMASASLQKDARGQQGITPPFFLFNSFNSHQQ
jgi:hypothetical protein